MTSSPASQQHAGAQLTARVIIWTALRLVGSVAVLVTLYYLLPLDRYSLAAVVVVLVVGLTGFVALVAFQVRQITRARHPTLRGVLALAISIPFFLLLFASTYVALASLSPASFGQHLSHTNALYFTVTVFATVGFGDITAKTETARLIVTVQMLTNLIVLGAAVKIIVGAARRAQQDRPTPDGSRTKGARTDGDG